MVRFRGAGLGGYSQEGVCFTFDEWELFLVRGGRFLIYHKHMERGDWCWATLGGREGDMNYPLSLEVLQEEYPELATSAGLQRIRVLDL